MPPARLTRLATPTRPASHGRCPALLCLALTAGGVGECIGFDRACQLTMPLVSQRGMAPPPAPAVAGPDRETQLPRKTTRRTGETPQENGKNPVRERPLALMESGVGEVVEGASAAMAPGAFAPGSIVVRAPGTDVLTGTAGPLEWALLPSQRTNGGLAGFSTETLVQM
jgi:hypothetical protein